MNNLLNKETINEEIARVLTRQTEVEEQRKCLAIESNDYHDYYLELVTQKFILDNPPSPFVLGKEYAIDIGERNYFRGTLKVMTRGGLTQYCLEELKEDVTVGYPRRKFLVDDLKKSGLLCTVEDIGDGKRIEEHNI